MENLSKKISKLKGKMKLFFNYIQEEMIGGELLLTPEMINQWKEVHHCGPKYVYHLLTSLEKKHDLIRKTRSKKGIVVTLEKEKQSFELEPSNMTVAVLIEKSKNTITLLEQSIVSQEKTLQDLKIKIEQEHNFLEELKRRSGK